MQTIEVRWPLPPLTVRDAAAPDLGGALTLTTARTDDPLAGVIAPTSSGANPAAAEVSHIQAIDAQLTSQLPVTLDSPRTVPLLEHLQTPADYDHYVAARTQTWKEAAAAGQSPGAPKS
ncbi:MAG: hypothetical protein ACLQDY_12045 [Streptosporangiaceae bacterium]